MRNFIILFALAQVAGCITFLIGGLLNFDSSQYAILYVIIAVILSAFYIFRK